MMPQRLLRHRSAPTQMRRSPSMIVPRGVEAKGGGQLNEMEKKP